MEPWLTVVITVVVFLIVAASIALGVTFGVHSKAKDIPEPSAPLVDGGAIGTTQRALPSFGFAVSETLESNVYVPDVDVVGGIKTSVIRDDILRINEPPHESDRFGAVRVSKDGTTLIEIAHRFTGVQVNRRGEVSRDAQNALIVYRRKNNQWVEYESNLASDNFQSFYLGDASSPVVGRGKYSFDVSALGSFCAVQEETETGSDIVWLYRYDGGINNYRGPPPDNLSTGRLLLEGQGGAHFGKVTKFLSDKRLMIATSSTDDNPASGGIFLFEQNPEIGQTGAKWFIQPTIGTATERILRPSDDNLQDPSFADVCASDGNALVVVASNPSVQRVHVFTRKDNRKLFDSQNEQVIHFQDHVVTDVVVSDPPNFIALGQPEGNKVVILRRQNDNSEFKIHQTIEMPTLLSGLDDSITMGFGSTVALSDDARALVVGSMDRIDGITTNDPRHYMFAYSRDPKSNVFMTSNIEGGPQYLSSENRSMDFVSLRVSGTDAELTRGHRASSRVVTYKLAQ